MATKQCKEWKIGVWDSACCHLPGRCFWYCGLSSRGTERACPSRSRGACSPPPRSSTLGFLCRPGGLYVATLMWPFWNWGHFDKAVLMLWKLSDLKNTNHRAFNFWTNDHAPHSTRLDRAIDAGAEGMRSLCSRTTLGKPRMLNKEACLFKGRRCLPVLHQERWEWISLITSWSLWSVGPGPTPIPLTIMVVYPRLFLHRFWALILRQ